MEITQTIAREDPKRESQNTHSISSTFLGRKYWRSESGYQEIKKSKRTDLWEGEGKISNVNTGALYLL